jgi:multicomponent Na+:H+ antiporter subunit B
MGDIMMPLYALMGFMLIAAVIAVETPDLLSSVLCLGAVGFGLALVDLLLKAPDLALTQIVVEIFAVVLLLRVMVTRTDSTEQLPGDDRRASMVGALLALLVFGCFVCFKDLVAFGQPLMTMGAGYLRDGVQTGSGNQVTAVLLDFRAYDTLGEATVIFAAVVGCYAILRIERKTDDVGNDTNS